VTTVIYLEFCGHWAPLDGKVKGKRKKVKMGKGKGKRKGKEKGKRKKGGEDPLPPGVFCKC
jgi:hypothetical protein